MHNPPHHSQVRKPAMSLSNHKRTHLLLDVTFWLLLAGSGIQPSCFSPQAAYTAWPLQALGESVLRKALEELQVWGLERRFTLYTYSSTAGTK